MLASVNDEGVMTEDKRSQTPELVSDSHSLLCHCCLTSTFSDVGDAFVFCYIGNAFLFVCLFSFCFHTKTSIIDPLLFSPLFELMDMYTGCLEFVCMGCENLAPYCTSTANECLACHASPSEVGPLLPCPTTAVIG